jgi:hypothetical protein
MHAHVRECLIYFLNARTRAGILYAAAAILFCSVLLKNRTEQNKLEYLFFVLSELSNTYILCFELAAELKIYLI